MADYLYTKFKGKYRVLPELCLDTNDFPRDEKGNIEDDAGTYIPCKNGSKISYWGLNSSRRGLLVAYFPNKNQGHNVARELKKKKIELFNYNKDEKEEVQFYFLASDIDTVAELMKAKTHGANISPFSPKNLPKSKDVEIPLEEMQKYKAITGAIDKKHLLLIKDINAAFLTNILEKDIRRRAKNKTFSWKEDARKLKLSRQVKEYIYHRGYWDKYLEYLDKKIKEHCCN